MDVPAYPKPLIITDAAVNISPTLDDKVDIVQNAIDLAHALGMAQPKVAILSAVETVNPEDPVHHRRGGAVQDGRTRADHGRLLDGPLAFDNAISREAAETKGIVSPVAGRCRHSAGSRPGSGNMLAKQLTFLADADAAGIVLGARVPIILTSRADSVRAAWRPAPSPRFLPMPGAARRASGGVIAMAEALLVINAGSSSVKFSALRPGGRPGPTLTFQGRSRASARIRASSRMMPGAALVDRRYGAEQVKRARRRVCRPRRLAAKAIERDVFASPPSGHRVVHGGGASPGRC